MGKGEKRGKDSAAHAIVAVLPITVGRPLNSKTQYFDPNLDTSTPISSINTFYHILKKKAHSNFLEGLSCLAYLAERLIVT